MVLCDDPLAGSPRNGFPENPFGRSPRPLSKGFLKPFGCMGERGGAGASWCVTPSGALLGFAGSLSPAIGVLQTLIAAKLGVRMFSGKQCAAVTAPSLLGRRGAPCRQRPKQLQVLGTNRVSPARAIEDAHVLAPRCFQATRPNRAPNSVLANARDPRRLTK